MIIGIPIGENKDKNKYSINQAYIEYIDACGFIPEIIPLLPGLSHIYMKKIDGLILPGGIDIDPTYYGYNNKKSFYVDPRKDEFERMLFNMAIMRGMPIFGICRGLQLIAYELLMLDPALSNHINICQHVLNHSQSEDLKVDRNVRSHFVNYYPELYQQKTEKSKGTYSSMTVNSMHHQCVLCSYGLDINTENFSILAWTSHGLSKKDGNLICEAFSTNWPKSKSKIMAVQWHPEELLDIELLANFFNQHQ
jgi:putative glutamine amidotransferase